MPLSSEVIDWVVFMKRDVRIINLMKPEWGILIEVVLSRKRTLKKWTTVQCINILYNKQLSKI